MDISKAAIYEIPMTGAALKYASGKQYVTTRGIKSILLLTDEEPTIKCRKLEKNGELNEREQAWLLRSIAEIARKNGGEDPRDRIGGFLDRLEKELEKRKEGGG